MREADQKLAARPELGCKDTDSGAVPDLVDLIEQVDDVEAYGRGLLCAPRELMRQPEIDLSVRRHVVRIGKSAAQAAAIDHVGAKAGSLPEVGQPARRGNSLRVVGVNVVVGNEGQFVG